MVAPRGERPRLGRPGALGDGKEWHKARASRINGYAHRGDSYDPALVRDNLTERGCFMWGVDDGRIKSRGVLRGKIYARKNATMVI